MEERSRRPAQKPEGPSGRGQRDDNERPEWQRRVERVRTDEKSPLIPSAITPEDLDIGARVQLKTLTAENAEMTARHLAMVALLIDDDPELAHKHALAASRRAGRLAIAHETLGLTAYAIGDFSLALRELLTHRRLSGSNEQLPLIVDSERGMERPDRALEAVVGVDRSSLSVGIRINLAIALSGVRLDMGDAKLALQELEIPELSPKSVHDQSPALFRAYAECLTELNRDGVEWKDLAARAEVALATRDGELFEVFEEISIPTSEEFEATMKPDKKDYKPQRNSDSSPRRESPIGAGRDRRPSGPASQVNRDGRAARSYEDKPRRADGTPGPSNKSSSYQSRSEQSGADKPRRDSEGERRPARSYEDRPLRGAGYSRPSGDSSRPREPRDDRPRDDRPRRESDRDARPARSFGDSPRREGGYSRPNSDAARPYKPRDDRPRDDRPRDDRPRRESDRDARPARSFGDSPRREGGYSRPNSDAARPSKPRDDGPRRESDRDARPARKFEERPNSERGYSRSSADSASPYRSRSDHTGRDRPTEERPARGGEKQPSRNRDFGPVRSSDSRPAKSASGRPVAGNRTSRGESKPRGPRGSSD